MKEVKTNRMENTITFMKPLEMRWAPKEDITAYELAQCIQYFYIGHVMPGSIDLSEPHLRHFEITDPNKN